MPDTRSAHVDASLAEHGHLGKKNERIDNDTISDHRCRVSIEDAAGDKLKGETLALDDQGVAGVVATLVAHHHRRISGEQVGELPLPLVAPLCS